MATQKPKVRRPFVRGANATPRLCQHCGREFKPKQSDRTTFCGRGCSDAHRRARADECSRRRAADRTAGLQRTCTICGAGFVGRTSKTSTCSRECELERGRRQWRESWVSVRESNAVVRKPCAECGKEFSTNFMATRRAYCSEVCGRRATRRVGHGNRRARLHAAFVAPVYRRRIIERDKGICQLCGDPVALERRAPDPLAPSLDHVIPLARGGTHEPGNVQLAHFLCNSFKRDLLPDEMALAG